VLTKTVAYPTLPLQFVAVLSIKIFLTLLVIKEEG
jgi:hypothetical protein